MFKRVSPENGAAIAGSKKGITSRTLLLVLLLVIAGGGYVFYFTDLIRPPKELPQPPAQAVQVKQPIPPRPPEQPGAVAPDPAKQESPASVAASGAVAGSPAKPGTPEKADAKVALAEAVKPAPAPKPAAPKAEPPKPAQPQAKQGSPAVASAKPPVPAKAPAAPPVSDKKTPVVQAKTVKVAGNAVPAAKPAGKTLSKGRYHLVLDPVPDRAVAEVLASLKASRLAPVKQVAVNGVERMNRVHIAEFKDQDTAEAELQQLKKLAREAFLIADNGIYNLYAGSYMTESMVKSEVKRLQAKGLKPVVRKAAIPVKMAKVTVGNFATSQEASKALGKLKGAGISGRIVKSVK